MGNENLFKNDLYYGMKKNLAFDTPQVEFSFGTGIFIRNLDIIKLFIYFNLIINIFKMYSEWANVHWILSIFRVTISLFVFSICVAILNLNKFESAYYIRLFLQIDTVINILIKTKILYGNPLPIPPVFGNSTFNTNATISNVFETFVNNTGIYDFGNKSLLNDSICYNTLSGNDNLNGISNLTNSILFQREIQSNIQY